MDRTAIKKQQQAAYASVKASYDNEVHLFIHCHLRGYDQKGRGLHQDAMFIDRYGAPISFEETWQEGYKSIEEAFLVHNEICQNRFTYFPMVSGYGGGAHLYKKYNEQQPWDWTGWIPLHNKLPYNAVGGPIHYYNRFFVGLRGNEIQNDMWDYDPGMLTTDEVVKGPYLGGYWYSDLKNRVEARYLHVISLKTHVEEDRRRYNYIVHPLAYRALLNKLPDCGVDGIQWSVNNILKEKHLTKDKQWGGKVHGIELFNDFTYYYSWIPHYGYKFHNGGVNVDGKEPCIVWYDTYPLEYCECILEKALSCGVYFQTLSANDAFYNRETSHIDNGDVGEDMEPAERILRNQALLSDPKGKYVTSTEITSSEAGRLAPMMLFGGIPLYDRFKIRTNMRQVGDEDLMISNNFLKSRPYGFDTVFGYTALLDTDQSLKKVMFPTEDTTDLNCGESVVMDYLIKGQFFSHTGIYDVFDYQKSMIQIPYVVVGQKNENTLWFNEEMKEFDLIFQFPPTRTIDTPSTPPWYNKLLWKYTIEYIDQKERVVSTGYFKLDEKRPTELNLQKFYGKFKVKWIRFTIFYYENPQQRAWFSPIKGKHFNTKSENLPLRNRIAITKQEIGKEQEMCIYTDTGEEFAPLKAIKNEKLDYIFEKGQEKCLHSYFMQVKPLQQTISSAGQEITKDVRFVENVHGYFALSLNYPTQLILSTSWDTGTVEGDVIYFYRVDGESCELKTMQLRASN